VAATLLGLHRNNFSKRSSVLPTQTVPAAAIVDASLNYFMVQKVGLQQNGPMMPRSPFSDSAKSCLTVGPSDHIGGVSLYWHACQNEQLTEHIDANIEENQMFSFTFSGHIRSKISGLCIRRGECQSRVAYDLSSCDDDVTASFRVSKAVANSLDHLWPMGTPMQAIADEMCDICGPYMLLSHQHHKNYEATPGWTKGRSQFVGEAAANGLEPPDSAGDISRLVKSTLTDGRRVIYSDPFVGDNTGLGFTDADGICGSYVTDGPAKESLFFLLRASAMSHGGR